MKKILAVLVSCSLFVLGSCAPDVDAKTQEKNKKQEERERTYFRYGGNFFVDARTGCLYAKNTSYSDSGAFPVQDPKGKQVGCFESGSMSVKEYLDLKPTH